MPALAPSSTFSTLISSTPPSPSKSSDLKQIGIVVIIVIGGFVVVFALLFVVRYVCEWMNLRGVQRENVGFETGTKKVVLEEQDEVYRKPPPACQGTPSIPLSATFPKPMWKEVVQVEYVIEDTVTVAIAPARNGDAHACFNEDVEASIVDGFYSCSSTTEHSTVEHSFASVTNNNNDVSLPVIEMEDVVVFSPSLFNVTEAEDLGSADKQCDAFIATSDRHADIDEKPASKALHAEQKPVFEEAHDECRLSIGPSCPSPSRFIVNLPTRLRVDHVQPSSTFLPLRCSSRHPRPSSYDSIAQSPTKGKGTGKIVSLSGGIRPLKLVGERTAFAFGDITNGESLGRPSIKTFITRKMAASNIPSPTKPLPEPENVRALRNPTIRSPGRYRAAMKSSRRLPLTS